MAKIKFRETPFIRNILGIYDHERAMASMSSSIVINDAPQGWLYTFGITNKECFIDGLEQPKAGGLSDVYRRISESNPEKGVKRNCEFFNFVYNTCYQYITDNQTRYFGRADLTDISHGKVFAMILIAHLCQKAMNLPEEEQDKYRSRIYKFTVELMNNDDIRRSSSVDGEMLSCITALDNICIAHQKQPAQEEDAIEKLFLEVGKTIGTMEEILLRVDQYTLPLITGQEGISGDQLRSYYTRAEDITLTLKQQGLLNNPLVVELYRKPHDKYTEEGGYKDLYAGLAYDLSAAEDNSFLLKHFDQGQKENFIRLLQLRDRLQVLKSELDRLYKFTKTNQITYLNDFLYLVDPYLKEMHRVRGELQACAERFDADCSRVYRARQEDKSWFQEARRQWEKIYYNKDFLDGLRSGIVALAHNIASTFARIPFDRFNALEERSVEAGEVVARGEVLFGADFSKAKSNFQEAIATAQQSELNRQAELILIKQQDISEEYEHLIKKAEASSDPHRDRLIELLKHRKKIIDDMIKAMMQQARDVEVSGIVDEDDFVVIEHSGVTLGMMEIEHQSGSFFQLIRNYLASPSTAAFEKLKLELEESKARLAEVEETVKAKDELISAKDREIVVLRSDVEARDRKVSAFQERFQVVNGVTATLLGLKSPELVEKLLTDDVINVDGLALPEAKKLQNVLVNYSNIIKQGFNYEKAYADNASRYEITRFFSHNENGKKHAKLVMADWQAHLIALLKHHVEQALIKNDNKVDEAFITELSARLSEVIGASIDHLVIDDKYSSYKQHSYRNYLYHFHQQIVDSHHTKIDLVEEPAAILSVDEVEEVVDAGFDEKTLRDFSKSLYPQQKVEDQQPTSSWLPRIF
ncbi:Uncharacterised protein [Legionella donaldsonii]|uniref:Uncharacterized protein n=1 Tax=Legionella donaldsonii TaxID=45060 RepID=A0A378J244_9GAMM|nr:hypothetical protein [Legionella donaldsonii]STX41812.1 Uncharacterised protein [Legionella donaldsonii]